MKYDAHPSVRKFQLVLYIYFHYLCKGALTNGPLDKGGYELDLVGLEASCPLPGKESGKAGVQNLNDQNTNESKHLVRWGCVEEVLAPAVCASLQNRGSKIFS